MPGSAGGSGCCDLKAEAWFSTEAGKEKGMLTDSAFTLCAALVNSTHWPLEMVCYSRSAWSASTTGSTRQRAINSLPPMEARAYWAAPRSGSRPWYVLVRHRIAPPPGSPRNLSGYVRPHLILEVPTGGLPHSCRRRGSPGRQGLSSACNRSSSPASAPATQVGTTFSGSDAEARIASMSNIRQLPREWTGRRLRTS